MPKISKKLRTVWKGPEEDGITQSLLSRFLCCRERFRLLVVEGLKPADHFNVRLEYGSMWHLCEEHVNGDWPRELKKYARNLAARYRAQGAEVQKWYEVCKRQFPVYVSYWSKHRDATKVKTLFSEVPFREKIVLPSGRTVHLRGKFDSVFEKGKRIYLQENKTKGTIDERSIQQQLLFDLQTMTYLIAFHSKTGKYPSGVRYNVVRRPLSGGKGSIVQHKETKTKPAETPSEFYQRLEGIIQEDPESFFMRWDVTITRSDVEKFRTQFLVPILEELWDWWEWVTNHLDDPWETAGNRFHWRFPYGVWNPALEGRTGDLDSYLESGSDTGLMRTNNLFPELDQNADD